MSFIAVVDYGMGNLRSVAKALEHVARSGQKVRITSSAEEIADADRVVFPGQGAARDCMRELNERDLIAPVRQAAKEKPFLGICMGLQVLMSHSEENDGVDCMDLFKGEVRFFGRVLNRNKSAELLKIPHMGWNNVTQTVSHPLWHGIKQGSRFYFVHSFYVDPADEAIVAGETEYDIVFTSAIACDNLFAVQFHPEKSAADGLQLLKNFAQWDGQ
ncbi:MAG: imidazole glycerol phosphate synthase subunit HisH [Gammaproteobacteria bacterium]|jgi:glutamine amidotransferase